MHMQRASTVRWKSVRPSATVLSALRMVLDCDEEVRNVSCCVSCHFSLTGRALSCTRNNSAAVVKGKCVRRDRGLKRGRR